MYCSDCSSPSENLTRNLRCQAVVWRRVLSSACERRSFLRGGDVMFIGAQPTRSNLRQARFRCGMAAVGRGSIPVERVVPLGLGRRAFRDQIAERKLCRFVIAARRTAVVPCGLVAVRGDTQATSQANTQVVLGIG